jgi:predicted GH43/DUF377 family glycosyl hydrolase
MAQDRIGPAIDSGRLTLRFSYTVVLLSLAVVPLGVASDSSRPTAVLDAESFRHYVETFNANDVEKTVNYIDNKAAWGWLEQNIPLFESSDKAIEEMYYFRWWTFRKHIKKTPQGFVITEFLPDVPWAGKFSTISCSAGHHFYEGRWLRDRSYLKDYARYWFKKDGNARLYSFWAADALRAWAMVTQDQQLEIDLYPELVENYDQWEKTHLDRNGLFWQIDDRDGMEISIGGSGYRPTINSYMYGDAMALADIAKWAWKTDQSIEFQMKAAKIRALVEDRLWDETAGFYKTQSRGEDPKLVDVREEIGFVPWYFNLPGPGHEVAWKQLMDPKGFYAPYGPTTAEQRHPRFMFQYPHECLWNGPSWPFATSQTLTAMANLLNNYRQDYVSKKDYLELLRIYTNSQHLKLPDGRVIPFIDEDLDPNTGEWIARNILYKMPNPEQSGKGDRDRGRDYNHSTYNDLIITGLVGLRPRLDQIVEINPLIPDGAMDYFCLDGVHYHGWNLTILYDKSGDRYARGKGLRLFADGQEIGSVAGLTWLRAKLPQTTAGWQKHTANPLIGGGRLGTVFDIAVLHEDGKYRMWGSWRPKKSLALFESADGIHWSDPEVVFRPEPATKWEDDINRPTVLKRADGYHLWYTGQAKGQSWIGYATSPDGRTWKRMSDKPVLSPELAWEKGSLMCPNVIWDEQAKLFRMWYSGGDQYEPDAIGCATSPDGLHWKKHPSNPIFGPTPENTWEQYKVGGAQVFRRSGWYYILYIGYRDMDHAQIGIARSRDGVTGWIRHPRNPIVRPGQGEFDQDACYKPYALFDGKRWLLWYNGRRGWLEQIGLVLHEGEDLGFGN